MVTMIHVCTDSNVIVEEEIGIHYIKIHAKVLSSNLLALNFDILLSNVVFLYLPWQCMHVKPVLAQLWYIMKDESACIVFNPLQWSSTIPGIRSNCMCHIIMYLCVQGQYAQLKLSFQLLQHFGTAFIYSIKRFLCNVLSLNFISI